MAPFRQAVCYYYQGRIRNQENDPILSRIRLKENIENFAEDKSGNILIQTSSRLYLYRADSSVREFDSINGQPLVGSSVISRSPSGNFMVQAGNSVFEFSEGRFSLSFTLSARYNSPNYFAMTPDLLVWQPDSSKTGVRSLVTGNITFFPYIGYRHKTYYGVGDTLVYACGSSGVTEFNIRTRGLKTFLEGIEVSRCLRDDEGNMWFATLGRGVYLLNSETIRNINLSASPYDKCSVYSITRYKDTLFAGTNHHVLFSLLLPALKERFVLVSRYMEKDRLLYLD
jgi:hypothetical protein